MDVLADRALIFSTDCHSFSVFLSCDASPTQNFNGRLCFTNRTLAYFRTEKYSYHVISCSLLPLLLLRALILTGRLVAITFAPA